MNLSDKPCYPLSLTTIDGQAMDNVDYDKSKETSGLTFRERLIIALASNPDICSSDITAPLTDRLIETNAADIKRQADAIIAEMEK